MGCLVSRAAGSEHGVNTHTHIHTHMLDTVVMLSTAWADARRLGLFPPCVNTHTWQHDVQSGRRGESVVMVTCSLSAVSVCRINREIKNKRNNKDSGRTRLHAALMNDRCFGSGTVPSSCQHPRQSVHRSVCVNPESKNSDFRAERTVSIGFQNNTGCSINA